MRFLFRYSPTPDFQGARVTSDGGLLVVRELDERLRLSELVDRHLSDSRRGKNIQLPLAELLQQSIYSRLAGYEDVNDAGRLSQDGVAAASVRKITLAYCAQCRPPAYALNGETTTGPRGPSELIIRTQRRP